MYSKQLQEDQSIVADYATVAAQQGADNYDRDRQLRPLQNKSGKIDGKGCGKGGGKGVGEANISKIEKLFCLENCKSKCSMDTPKDIQYTHESTH